MGCLGDGSYDARLVRRVPLEAPRVLGEPDLLAGSWERLISATSTATALVEVCGHEELLARAEEWLVELELWRDGGLAWAGPVRAVTPTDEDGGATAVVAAEDVSAWWSVTPIDVDLVYRDADLATILVDLARRATTTGLEVDARPTGIVGDRTYAALDLRMVADEVEELARTGCDWTVTGRQLWIGGQEIAPGRRLVEPLTADSFRAPPRGRRPGGWATEVLVRGSAVTGRAGGPDPGTGVRVVVVVDAQTIEDQGSADAAAATTLDRLQHPPLVLDGDAELAPGAGIEADELIPGLVVRTIIDGAVPIDTDLRLERVSASFGRDGEQITVGLQPLGTVEEDA